MHHPITVTAIKDTVMMKPASANQKRQDSTVLSYTILHAEIAEKVKYSAPNIEIAKPIVYIHLYPFIM